MSNSRNGAVVRELEEQFAKYVGAQYGIACANGTATLHTALVALGVKPGDRVAVPPLTMASTTLGVLHAGARPVFVDVDPDTWLMNLTEDGDYTMPVSLYGLNSGHLGTKVVDDAAETLNPHGRQGHAPAFSSFSFQASKILSAGEGGMLVTNDSRLAERARQFSRLGYPNGKVSDLKRPDAIRHEVIGYNYRMSDVQANVVLRKLASADELLSMRRYSAQCYREAIQGCDWITPQHVPEGWPHSWWTYAIALDAAERAKFLSNHIAGLFGGEFPYPAWRITYHEPAFRHLASDGSCPVAESLQPRLLQLQTNHDKAGAERAADILHKAIRSLS